MQLQWSEPAGGTWPFLNLKPGKYTLEVTYENTAEMVRSLHDQAADPKVVPFWFGKETKELKITVAPQVAETPEQPVIEPGK